MRSEDLSSHPNHPSSQLCDPRQIMPRLRASASQFELGQDRMTISEDPYVLKIQ